MNKTERIKMVKAMEFICRQVNNEEFFAGWLINGVADDDIEYGDLSDEDNGDLEIYYEDDECFSELMDCFLHVMRLAKRDGGLYCDGVASD